MGKAERTWCHDGSVLYRARVKAAHEPPEGEPIEIHPGDPLRIDREDPEHPGWWHAAAADGRSGWVPDSYARVRGAEGSALVDYTARELAAVAGDTVGVILELYGWAWCEAADGRTGWLPVGKLEAAAGPV